MIEGERKPTPKPPRRHRHGGVGAKRRRRLRRENQAKEGTKNAQVPFNKVTLCFKEGDKVLIAASPLSLVPGKLLTRWSGPLTVTRVFPYGTVEKLAPVLV
ncbi:hypothetical protein LINGRAHAP2_LOCUS5231 [Linum grandiflorum]